MARETHPPRLVIEARDGFVSLSFHSLLPWRLEYSADLRGWQPFVSGNAGEHRVGLTNQLRPRDFSGWWRMRAAAIRAVDAGMVHGHGQGHDKPKKPKHHGHH